jgi:hypothetical protein
LIGIDESYSAAPNIYMIILCINTAQCRSLLSLGDEINHGNASLLGQFEVNKAGKKAYMRKDIVETFSLCGILVLWLEVFWCCDVTWDEKQFTESPPESWRTGYT